MGGGYLVMEPRNFIFSLSRMSVFAISRKYSCRTMSEAKSKPSKGSTKKKEGDPDAKVLSYIHLLLVALLLQGDPTRL